ncbi:MAG: bifunctional UDP-N-acetylmuramoyl-tripeptide:D-alanyl-D-alanine ligase/alanine racemase [Bacteroidia bacterium]
MLSLKTIAALLNSVPKGNAEREIKSIFTDSRTVSEAGSSLFIALVGERHNGHNYIADLYEKGVKSFLISDAQFQTEAFPEAGFILVDNTLRAFQYIAAWRRNQFTIPIIGITGSNGKTIVKEWLYQMMREEHNICRSPKSYNSQTGVPLSVWQLNPEHTFGIFEAGISKAGEMEKLKRIIQPTIGILTNIGSAHDEGFTNTEEKTLEKLKLFHGCRQLVYCMDNSFVHEHLYRMGAFTWSKESRNADLFVSEINTDQGSSTLKAIYNDDLLELKINFSDSASIENAITCWATLLMLGYRQNSIAERMLQLHPVAMRLEMKQGINNCSVINDSYNSDLASLAIALDFLNQQHQHPKKILVLSDILQTGRSEKELYAEVAALIKTKGIHQFIGIGPVLGRNKNLFEEGSLFYQSTEEFIYGIHTVLLQQFANATILLKGARDFEFERINSLLQQKSHDTVLEINLNNLVHNVNYFRSKLKPGTKVMAMVKASSYGSGSYEIASSLQFHRADYLAVAYADEGVELRKAGISLPVMVMSPEVQAFEDIVNYKLEPELFSFRILHLFSEYLEQNNLSAYPVHLKLDTGMHRLGFDEDEIEKLAEELKKNNRIKVTSVFSHMAASDEAALDGFTQEQVALFKDLSERISAVLPYPFLRHICNSGGIVRFPEAHFDMVRLGIGMYGVAVNDTEQQQLLNVSTLKTTISQLKQLEAGDTVGYSRKGKITKPTLMATVPIGYADGLSRKLGNGKGCMYVHGKAAPLIGSVCMDMCMLDVTGISCNEGDEVIIFDSIDKLNAIAAVAESISYEVLTSVSTRVKRIYVQE